MAGDRRATMGNVIAHRDIEKVFPADQYSAAGIAGTAGIALEIIRLFQVELEHYEKIEGAPLQPGRQGEPARRHGAGQPAARRCRGSPVRPAPGRASTARPASAGSSPTT